MSADALTVMYSPCRSIRVSIASAEARTRPGARASVRKRAAPKDMPQHAAAAYRAASPADLPGADARPSRQGEDRVAVGPGDGERGGLAPGQPFAAQVLGGVERDRKRLGQREAEDVLEVVRDPRRVAALVLLEDLEAVLDSPVAQIVAGRIQAGLLAHLADRGVAKGLRLVREAARDRLPESLPAGALHHQHPQVRGVDHHEHRAGNFVNSSHGAAGRE